MELLEAFYYLYLLLSLVLLFIIASPTFQQLSFKLP